MKKFLTMAFAAFATFAFTGCNDDDPADKFATTNNRIVDGKIQNNMLFLGTTLVKAADAEDAAVIYTEKDITFEVTGANGAGESMLYMHATKFMDKMPAMEMRLPLSFTGSNKTVSAFSAMTVPEAQVSGQWAATQSSTMTGIDCKIDNVNFYIAFNCRGFFVQYWGALLAE